MLIALHHDRICRRRHRRSRHLRHQRRLAPAGPLPRQELRGPRAPGEPRRHLGPVQVPGHPLGLRHVHARLPVQAVDVGEGHRRRPVDHVVSEGDGRRVRHRQAHPVRPEGGRPPTGPMPTTTGPFASNATAKRVEIKTSFLFAASGYYNYDEGYTPEFAGADDFEGTIIHPQHWPEELDYAGKKIVVIGSGATAVTLIPALADSGAGHVTMLQRSPTYIGALPDVDPFTVRTNKTLPDKPAYVLSTGGRASCSSPPSTESARRFPKFMRKTLMTMAERRLPEGYDVAEALRSAATTRGISDCAWRPTAICSRPSARARPTSSPTRSSASPRPASSWPRVRSYRPTSSSPQRV